MTDSCKRKVNRRIATIATAIGIIIVCTIGMVHDYKENMDAYKQAISILEYEAEQGDMDPYIVKAIEYQRGLSDSDILLSTAIAFIMMYLIDCVSSAVKRLEAMEERMKADREEAADEGRL